MRLFFRAAALRKIGRHGDGSGVNHRPDVNLWMIVVRSVFPESSAGTCNGGIPMSDVDA